MFHFIFRLLLLLSLPIAAFAAPVTAELVGTNTTVAPGATPVIALHLSLEKGWHTYWKNPGDTGFPITLKWTLPPGVETISPLEFPPPRAQVFGAYMNYGYSDDVLLPTKFKIADPLSNRQLVIKARADWLQCEKICVPASADLSYTLAVGAKNIADKNWSPKIEAALKQPPELKDWALSAKAEGDKILLKLSPKNSANAKSFPGALYFFSAVPKIIEPSFAQTLKRDGESWILSLPVSYQFAASNQPLYLSGLLRADKKWNAAAYDATLENIPVEGKAIAGKPPKFDAPPAAQVPGENASRPAPPFSLKLLLLTLLAAILGGAILNLMPCVFPVISIKALSLFKHHDQRKTLRREALFFSAGVILSFAALGAALAALRAGGAELGWGFQLQSPRMVLFLILLFFAMALNLSGVYEFGMFAQGAMSKTKNNATAFLSGVLAVAVASPCTAPFMGAALGFALTQPLAATLSIFIALGVGMALPYSLLAFFPMWAKYLPRPGVWMDDLKKILAFPLYATVAWLMWVLISQTNSGVALGAMFALCALALALWANQRRRAANMMSYRTAYAWLVLAIAALAAAVYFAAPAARFSASAQKTSASLVWQNYDPARIQELNAEGKTVFADFTAAWCVTCQINEKLALDDAAVQSAFEKHRIVLMRADWTNRDAQIEQTLARLGRNGVPVYVFYRPGKSPELLPELLRAQTVIDAIERTTETLNAKR